MLSAPAGPRGHRATRPRRPPQARAGVEPGGQAEQLGECSPWGVGGVWGGTPPCWGTERDCTGRLDGGWGVGRMGFLLGRLGLGWLQALEGGQVAPTPWDPGGVRR